MECSCSKCTISGQMVVMSRSSSSSHSFIAYWIWRPINSNCKMCFVIAKFIIWWEFSQFINFSSKWFCGFESNRSKSVDRLIKIQSARTEILEAEAIDIVFAIRLIEFACRNFNNYRVSYWTSVCIDNFDIDITSMILRNFASSTQMAVEDRRRSSNRKFRFKNILN